MRILILLTALLLSPSLLAQISVTVKPSRDQFISYEPLKVEVSIRNQSGRLLNLKNTPSNGGWIEFVVRNQSGRTVQALSKKAYSPTRIATGQNIKSTFTLNNAYSLDLPGNYTVYAIVRTAEDTIDQGARSAAAHFTVNRGNVSWRSKVGVAGASGDQREYRIIETRSGRDTPPLLYIQVEDVKKGRILATYPMGSYLSFRKPLKTLDRKNNLHVLFLSTPKLSCHTVINPSGKTIKRNYLKSIGNAQPGLVTQVDGSVYVSNAVIYDAEKERQENEKFHNLSEIPGSFEQ